MTNSFCAWILTHYFKEGDVYILLGRRVAKVTVFEGHPRITSVNRDGVEIGDLDKAVDGVLAAEGTIGIATNSEQVLRYLRGQPHSKLEWNPDGTHTLEQSAVRAGTYTRNVGEITKTYHVFII